MSINILTGFVGRNSGKWYSICLSFPQQYGSISVNFGRERIWLITVIVYYHVRKLFWWLSGLKGLVASTPHAVPFFKNKISYSALKTSKTHVFLGRCSIVNALNLRNREVTIQNCALLLDLFALFWAIPHTCPYFIE